MRDMGLASRSLVDRSSLGRRRQHPRSNLAVTAGLSNVGDGIVATAIPLWLVTTGVGPFLVAAASAVARLAWLVFALPAGVWADRLPARWLLVSAQAFRGTFLLVVVATMAAGSAGTAAAALAVLAVVSALEVPYDTAIDVGAAHVGAAGDRARLNSAVAASGLAGQSFVGPPLAAWLVTSGVHIALGAAAAAYAVSAVAGWRLPSSPTQVRERSGPKRSWSMDVNEAVANIRGDHPLHRLLIASAILAAADSVFGALLVVHATRNAEVRPETYGLVVAGAAAAALAASIAAPRAIRRLGIERCMAAAAAANALSAGGVAGATSPYMLGMGWALFGGAAGLFAVAARTFRHARTVDRAVGGITGVFRWVVVGVMPLAALVGGGVAEVLTVRTVMWLAAAAYAAVAIALVRAKSDASRVGMASSPR